MNQLISSFQNSGRKVNLEKKELRNFSPTESKKISSVEKLPTSLKGEISDYSGKKLESRKSFGMIIHQWINF